MAFLLPFFYVHILFEIVLNNNKTRSQLPLMAILLFTVFLEASFLAFKVRKFTSSFKLQLKSEKKIFFLPHRIRHQNFRMYRATSPCPCSNCRKKPNPNACSIKMTPVCTECGPAIDKCEKLTPVCPYVCCPSPSEKPKCTERKPCGECSTAKNQEVVEKLCECSQCRSMEP